MKRKSGARRRSKRRGVQNEAFQTVEHRAENPGVGSSNLPSPANQGFRQRNRFRFSWREPIGRTECPYAYRWSIETPIGSVRIHKWIGSDDPRAHHDHAWWFLTFILKGGYDDITEEGTETLRAGNCRYRSALHKHTVSVHPGGAWTFIITGPHVRFWGFYPDGKYMKSNRYFLEKGNHPCD